MGADYSFYVKTIETHARTFLPLNISAIGTVHGYVLNQTQITLMQVQAHFSRLEKFANPPCATQYNGLKPLINKNVFIYVFK